MDRILEKYQPRLQAIADHSGISLERLMISIIEIALSELEDAMREGQIPRHVTRSYLDLLPDNDREI